MNPTTALAPVVSALTPARAGGFEVHFLPSKVRVGQMRWITVAHLRRWKLDDLVAPVRLAVSELVTNAIQHGGGRPVGLRVTCSAHELRIAVTDGNPAPARLGPMNDTAEGGRGLFLVAILARDWGVSPDGKTTWCAFTVPAGRGA